MGIAEGVWYTETLKLLLGKNFKTPWVFFSFQKYCLTVNTIVSNFKILRRVPYFLLKMNPFSKPGLPPYCFFLCIQDIRLQKVFLAVSHSSSHADLRQETRLSKQKNKYYLFSLLRSFSYIPYGKII